MLQSSAAWSGGGLSRARVDRAAVRSRLADDGFSDTPAWIWDELMDAYEPAALAAIEARREAEQARKPKPRSENQEAADG